MTVSTMLRCPRHEEGVVVEYDAVRYPDGCPICAHTKRRQAPDRPMSLREYDEVALAPMKYGPPTGR